MGFQAQNCNCLLPDNKLMAEIGLVQGVKQSGGLRSIIVAKIMLLRQKVCFITRGCVCLGITIFDKCQEVSPELMGKKITLTEEYYLVSVACLGLAFKFQKGDKFAYTSLLKATQQASGSDEQFAKVLKLQALILEGLKWKIPHQTAYDHLEEAIEVLDYASENTRQRTTMCLKILLTAYSLDPEVSLNPGLGCDLYKIMHKKRPKSCQAKQLYLKCVNWIQKQMQVKNGH